MRTGSIEPKGINKPFFNVLTHKVYPPPTTGLDKPKKRTWKDIDWLAPVAVIFSEKDIALVLLYGAVLYVHTPKPFEPVHHPDNQCIYRYSLTFAVIVTLASDLKDTYGLSTLEDGLCYMAYGFGAVISSFVARPVMDRDFAKVAEKASKKALEEGGEHAVSP